MVFWKCFKEYKKSTVVELPYFKKSRAFIVLNTNQKPLIVEINYGFAYQAYLNCPDYQDKELNWHGGKFHQMEWILEEYLKK